MFIGADKNPACACPAKRLKHVIFMQTAADSFAAKAETLLCHTLPRLPTYEFRADAGNETTSPQKQKPD